MKILSLLAENTKRIHVVEITPDGDIVIIGGDNGNGKSSVLDAIADAIGGEKESCPMPVRVGAKKSKTVVTMDEDLIVTKTRTAAGGVNLVVTNKAGAKFPSPQALLDSLFGKLTFDPLAFSQLEGPKQLDTLRKIVGLDFTKLDADKKAAYDDRTLVNRDIEREKASLLVVPFDATAPEAAVSVADLMVELNRIQVANQANETQRTAYNAKLNKYYAVEAQVKTITAKVAEIEKQLADAKNELELATKDARNWSTALDTARAEVEKLVDEDDAPTRQQIQDSEAVNARVRQNAKHNEIKGKLSGLVRRAENLTAKIEDIDAEKQTQLSEAKFPIPGLSFDENGVSYNGVPLEQASDAERIRVSVAMAMAMNPKLKIMLCKNGSLLDSKSMALLSQIVTENGYQLWLEKVSKGAECAVILEDGYIAGAARPEEAE